MAELSYTFVIRSECAQQTNPDPNLAVSDYWVFVPQLVPGGDNNQKYKMVVKSVLLSSSEMDETNTIIECYIESNGAQCTMDVKNNGPTASAAQMALVGPTDLCYTLIGAPSRVVAAPNNSNLHVQWRKVVLEAGGDDALIVGDDGAGNEVPIPHHIIVLEFTPIK